MILQPTSPMRRSTDINEAINLFKKKDCDSVISICVELEIIQLELNI